MSKGKDMLNDFRYWLSALLLDWSMRLIPDEPVRYVMRAGIQSSANILLDASQRAEQEVRDNESD